MAIEYVMIYLLVGAVAGFLAGMMGIGGAIVIVPALLYVFVHIGAPQAHLIHLAAGTSLAAILFSSASSIRAHHFHGAVDWATFKRITPGILIGTFVGAQVAGLIPSLYLQWFFTVFIFYVAVQMLVGFSPASGRVAPGWGGMTAAGLFMGVISSFVGIGGGSLSVPFLSWCNFTIHRAIGTSAAIGFPIAVAGTVGYIVSGWSHQATLPPYSLGFVYLPAVLCLVMASTVTVNLGAKLAHSLPVPKLKKAFAVLLFCIAVKMLFDLI